MATHGYDLITRKTEAGRNLCVQDHPGLDNELQAPLRLHIENLFVHLFAFVFKNKI